MMCTPVWPLAVILVALLFLSMTRRCWRRVGQGRLPCVPRRCRHWRPRTPDDCAHCRQEGTLSPRALQTPGVRPWREGRSRRGAPRRIATEGYACHTPGCPYAGITDSQVPALVADGHHGRTDHIQDFTCQACGCRGARLRAWGGDDHPLAGPCRSAGRAPPSPVRARSSPAARAARRDPHPPPPA